MNEKYNKIFCRLSIKVFAKLLSRSDKNWGSLLEVLKAYEEAAYKED